MIFKKTLPLILLMAGFLFGQSAPEFFKKTPVRHALKIFYNNSAALQTEKNTGSWYRYGFENASGSLHHPMAPASTQYHSVTAAGYKKLGNQTLFSGTFTYRQHLEFDRLFRQNSTLNGMIPVYMADSSAGDWHLNGIQWTVDVKKPLTERLSGGLSIFYMVDEQYKQNFPKPGVKRSGYHVNGGLFYDSPAFDLSGSLGIFEFKEEMKTVKYSLEQHLSPVFMLFRGFGDPIYYRGQTSYERLQTRQGFSISAGISFNLLPGSPLKTESTAEWSRGEAVDGGTNNIPQGDWVTQRLISRFSWVIGEKHTLSPVLEFENHYAVNEADHPDFPLTLYQSQEDFLQGFGGVSLKLSTENTLQAGVAMERIDAWREDVFNGIGLEGKKIMLGPALSFTFSPPVPFEAEMYLKCLTEVSKTSRIKTSSTRGEMPVNRLTEDELWALTTGNFILETGTEIRSLEARWANLSLDVNYRWTADINDNRSVNTCRSLVYLSLTFIPHDK